MKKNTTKIANIKNFFTPIILLSLFGVFFIKFVFSFLPSFSIDMGTWLAWAFRMNDLGPSGFYSSTVWTQYTPGYLYWLWLIGKLGVVFEAAIKIPTIITDILTGGIIWIIVKKENQKVANILFFLYSLSPILIFNGSVWGQVDSIYTLFLFLSVYYLIESKNPILVGLFWAIAFLIKPQAIAMLPPLIFLGLKNFSFKKNLLVFGVAAMVMFLLALPFFPKDPIFGFANLLKMMTGYYSYTSVFAFNLWSVVGMWKSDQILFSGVSYFNWGIILYLTFSGLIFWFFRKSLNEKKLNYLFISLFLLASFVFPTRVHERYLFPFFAFFITAVGLFSSKKLLWVYLVITVLSLINLYHPYAYYSHNFLRNEELLKVTTSIAPLVGALTTIMFFVTLAIYKFNRIDNKLLFDFSLLKVINNLKLQKSKELKFPEIKLSTRASRILLGLILGFALFSRILFLNSPQNEYFDEVYHAFTARTILHRELPAWEWWNTPPEGFAYEWTHPPVAKLGMVFGMLVFGENSFGWRFPGALLGVGCVFLIYLISKHLFKDEILALFSSFVFSLDGLGLVMSRIGMNDTYHLFFILLAIYLFLKDKIFFSSIAYGMALSSKWSALWAVPIFLVIWFVYKRSFKLNYLWFLVVPPLVYFLSYFDMFMTGHDLYIWWGMQKQMWWYHTNLRATHPYTSSWWSWPLLIRPIYLYTSSEIGGFVSRIYAFGNPFVFWSGLVAVFLSIIDAIKTKSKPLIVICFSYIIFFVPWALSPRIMFLYHYLPSLPFLAIATGYFLRRNMKIAVPILISFIILFIYFYPHWAGLNIPLWLDKSYYWFTSWR